MYPTAALCSMVSRRAPQCPRFTFGFPRLRGKQRRNGNRGVADCALLLARILAHWIKVARCVSLHDLRRVGEDVEFKTVAKMCDHCAMLATSGSDMARRPGQRGSVQLWVVCGEVSSMLEGWMNEPSLVPLSWVGYLALVLAEGEGLRVPFGCVVLYSSGGRFVEIQRFCLRGEVG